jgi:hypothetical protein
MSGLVRVTTVLRALIPLDDRWWQSKHRRRGRLVDTGLTLLAQGKTIDPAWWSRHSGETPDDRVEHEECRAYIDSGAKFLAEFGFELRGAQVPLRCGFLGYVGHPDWIGHIISTLNRPEGSLPLIARSSPYTPGGNIIIDLKVGSPPSTDSPYDWYCRLQLAAYQVAYVTEYAKHIRRANLFLQPDEYHFIERTVREDAADWKAMVDYYHRSQKWSESK